MEEGNGRWTKGGRRNGGRKKGTRRNGGRKLTDDAEYFLYFIDIQFLIHIDNIFY